MLNTNHMNGFVYLACPYSHPNPQTMEMRYHCVNKMTAQLMEDGIIVFSPISHCHEVARYLPSNDLYYRSWDFWREYDFAFLRAARELLVLTLHGWQDSVGVTAEIAFAKECAKPIRYLPFEYSV